MLDVASQKALLSQKKISEAPILRFHTWAFQTCSGFSEHSRSADFALLKRGANPRFETRLGENALTASFAPDNSEMLELVYHSLGSVRDEESIITGATPLIHAFNSPCCTEAVPMLLRLGENIAHETRDGRTALIAASLSGIADRVALCLRNGAKANQETRTGVTAISSVI